MKLPQDLFAQPARGEIVARASRLVGLPQVALVVSGGAREQLEQALSPLPTLRLARVLPLALQLHAIALGEQLERPFEVDALGLLHEREHIARRLAAEAVVDLLRGVDAERGRSLLVERAQPLVPRRAGAPQLCPRADELDEIHRLAHAFAGLARVQRHRAQR